MKMVMKITLNEHPLAVMKMVITKTREELAVHWECTREDRWLVGVGLKEDCWSLPTNDESKKNWPSMVRLASDWTLLLNLGRNRRHSSAFSGCCEESKISFYLVKKKKKSEILVKKNLQLLWWSIVCKKLVKSVRWVKMLQ